MFLATLIRYRFFDLSFDHFDIGILTHFEFSWYTRSQNLAAQYSSYKLGCIVDI